MQKLIILRGYPGSGKTTIGKLLEKDGYGIFIDHNSILTSIASITGDDYGIYEEIYSLELAMAKKLLNDGKSVIVARGFSGKNTLEPYLKLAENDNVEALVFTLQAPISVLEERVISPERKKDFNPTISTKALHEWVNKNPIESYEGEFVIDVSTQIDHVLKNITQLISK